MSLNNIHKNYRILILYLIGFCLITTNPVSTEAQTAFYISETLSEPVMDGLEDAGWMQAESWPVSHLYGGQIEDAADFSGFWKAMWDSNNLYLLFQVNDKSLFNLGPGADKFWIHDCAELFVDLLNEKDNTGTGELPDDDNYQYRFIWDLDDEPIFEAPPSEDLANVSSAIIDGTDTTGWQIEVSIPWTTLIGSHPFGDINIGKQIGVEVKLADLDTPAVPSGVWAPDAELLWNNTTSSDLKIPSMFGTIQLVHTLEGDKEAPESIVNLQGETLGSSLISLSWTAPEDFNTGRVAAYELFFGTDSALVAAGLGNKISLPGFPEMPGSAESFTLDSLEAGTSYYFGLISNDGLGNISALSNVISQKTFDPDITPPDPINDLKVDSSGSFMADLSWTSPGDDGITGTASAYEIRYFTSVITLENWEAATLCAGAPAPVEAGQKQSFRVQGLEQEKTYFFAIRSMDEAPNYSGLSNIVEFSTPPFSYEVKHSVDQMIGTNAFIDVPMENMEALSFIREYHPWSFTEIEDDVFEYNRWNGFWDFDKYYEDLKNRGITVCPALWSSPDWLEPNSTNKPLGENEDAEDPFSYHEMAQLMFQYAARYGSTAVADEKLLVNAGQVKKSGLGLLSYFEDWNEQDRDWEGRDAHFTAREYAAMASANVDGHAGSMGDGLGLKTADPSAKFVMGGLYILGTDYISDMYTWFKENRSDQSWPIDVINMHHYAYTQEKNGICPEEDGYKSRVQEVINWRNEYAPENEVWITEFGYDTNDESPNRINPFGSFTQEEIQAQWIVRTYLLLSSIGVDRAAQFMIRDVDPNPEPRWSDCGLTLSPSEGSSPKTSWYYVYTLKNILKGYYFDRVIAESNSSYVYRFINETGDQFVYALWSPTGDASTADYRLKIPANPNSLRKIAFMENSTTGSRENLDTSSDLISLEVGESPIFLLANYGDPDGQGDQKELAKFMVFPNPCGNSIQLHLPGIPEARSFKISIYSSDGRVVKQMEIPDGSSTPRMDIAELKNGIYILVAKTGKQIFTDRVVKQ